MINSSGLTMAQRRKRVDRIVKLYLSFIDSDVHFFTTTLKLHENGVKRIRKSKQLETMEIQTETASLSYQVRNKLHCWTVFLSDKCADKFRLLVRWRSRKRLVGAWVRGSSLILLQPRRGKSGSRHEGQSADFGVSVGQRTGPDSTRLFGWRRWGTGPLSFCAHISSISSIQRD